MHPRTAAAIDRGRADASLQLSYVTLTLQPSAAQQADLTALLDRQQDPSSPDYHRWLTPESYADRFGLAQTDIDKIVAWLQSQGLAVLSVARGRNAISFSGPVRAVEAAFGTEIHRYSVNGELHYANASEPSIPAILSGIIAAIHGLNDFRLKAPRHSVVVRPAYTNASFCGNYCLAPGDLATIYDIQPLYAASVDGTGQKIVVVGQTQINPADIQQFRTYFNLPANLPQLTLVPKTTDPGVSVNDLLEGDLDVEWAGALARGATIVYVYTTDVDDAVQYAIDQNLAPVLTMSYGQCETLTAPSDLTSWRTWALQGNTQGITWVSSAGDNGGADCAGLDNAQISDSQAVDAPGSIPEVTSVGGTEFNESIAPMVTFWNPSNDPATHASALLYIPEKVWNDSAVYMVPAAGGGGPSAVFNKPPWQTGVGVPKDNARDVPDISLAASGYHDGYLMFSSNGNSTGSGVVFSASQLTEIGGTSAAVLSMAGIVTLINQYLVQNGFQTQSGLGNMNPRLYALAQSSPGVFHDITTGDNIVEPCVYAPSSCPIPQIGFPATVGYDLASGLGSIDTNNLVLAWHQGATGPKTSPAVTLTAAPSSITTGGAAVLKATITGSNGGVTPTGTATFFAGSTSLGAVTLVNGAASLNVNGSQLSVGANTISIQYSGDSAYNSASATTTLTVAVKSATTLTLSSNPPSITVSGSAVVTATVSTANGGTPTGTIAFSLGTASLGSATLSGGAANISVNGSQLILGANTISAQYSGDDSYNASTATVAVTVTPAAPGMTITGATNAASFMQVYAPGMILAVFGSNLGPPAQMPQTVPLPTSLGGVTATINGIPAPFYFVSPGQVNIQVPYETPVNTTVVLQVAYNGQSASISFNVSAAAPGIFSDANNGNVAPVETAAPGDVLTAFMTGDGAESPSPATGSTPPPGTIPQPTQNVTMSVGGIPVIPLFVGLPSWSIGVTQINFKVPANIAPGTQKIVVTVGSVSSAPVNLTVTQ
jgi:uncharacterized protein (TIGR03437 family)